MESQEVRLARMEERFNTVVSDVASIKDGMKSQDEKLDKLVLASERSKGARAVTKTLFGLVTSGGFIGWMWEHFHK